MYSIQTIGAVIGGTFLQQADEHVTIRHLVYDSRKVQFAATSLFFALVTERSNGHHFIHHAYQQGVRCFVVAQVIELAHLANCNVIHVPDTLTALQHLAAHHRKLFKIPLVGITGSNGKTIVKEWLYQLLQDDYNIVRSPKSFNSQIGVPLSVWQLKNAHTLGIFEAGISRHGEMKKLATIIQPTIGVLTNIGEAHSEGFTSNKEKLQEKLELFETAAVFIAPETVFADALPAPANAFLWGTSAQAQLHVKHIERNQATTDVTVIYNNVEVTLQLPFTDAASIENAITCCAVLICLGKDLQLYAATFSNLHAVEMRLRLMQGLHNCTLINDSYSADLTSLQIALNFMHQQNSWQKRTVIVSDFIESGREEAELYAQISSLLQQYGVTRVIAIGEQVSAYLPALLPAKTEILTYPTTALFIQQFESSLFKDELVLIKGARKAQFEKIVHLLEFKVHKTVLEINLNAVINNLNQYQQLLQPGTKIMAMVKAFAYGSGGAEIARVLQYHNVHYLGVAYADEGVDLRKAGVTKPIMVMNTDETTFQTLLEYGLQPVLYSFALLQQFESFLRGQGVAQYPVHVEIETGMNRLGFAIAEMKALGEFVAQANTLKIESVYSHLAASEDAAQDAFTNQQAQLFQKAIAALTPYIPYPFLKHIANSAAILRHPHLQMDMVRLGIGLYGVEIATDKLELQPATTFRSTIAQLKKLQPGDTVSYNRRGVVATDTLIATVRIGYADGYSRRFGHGVGKMVVRGRLAPVIGTVCMDMTMIDVTGIPGVQEGDDVVIFGDALPVQQVARWIDTIPYELMTGVSGRVKRIYYQE